MKFFVCQTNPFLLATILCSSPVFTMHFTTSGPLEEQAIEIWKNSTGYTHGEERYNYHQSMLEYAAPKKYNHLAKMILEKLRERTFSNRVSSTTLAYTFILAAGAGNCNLLQLLFAESKNVLNQNPNKWLTKVYNKATALMLACWWGHIDAVKLLLEWKADTEIIAEDGCTALSRCIERNHPIITRLLLDHHANPNGCAPDKKFKYLLPWTLTASDRLPHAKLLLDAGADCNCLTAENETPLMVAVAHGNFAGITLLLAHGADGNIKKRDSGITALMKAVEINSGKAVRSLLQGVLNPKFKSDLEIMHSDKTNYFFLLPLELCAEIAQYRINLVSPWLKNNTQQTALDIAMKYKNDATDDVKKEAYVEIISFLQEAEERNSHLEFAWESLQADQGNSN